MRSLTLGAYSLMHREEGKSNHVLQVVEDNEFAVSFPFFLGNAIKLLFIHEF